MKNMVRVMKHEFKEAIAPAIFFFIAFHLVAATKTLILEAYKMTPTGVAVATVVALTVAKAVLIADKLPFISRFSGKPLILSVLWKTAIYGVLCFVFRCIEELIPFLLKHEGLGTAVEHLISDVSWPHFWALQIWLMVALILYNAVTELDKHLGEGSMRRVFFGTGPVKG
ncbi:MAG: hypothetical protein OEN48_13030 [Betaproteobacteria bacterium]|nr:hypothetical protein [Betaproteobacteria bacterium]